MKFGGAFKQGQGHAEAFDKTNDNQNDETHTMDQLKPFVTIMCLNDELSSMMS